MTAMPSIFCKHPVTRRVFFAMQKHSKKDAQKLHALWLLPIIVVRILRMKFYVKKAALS